jgi:DNA ligase 1
VLLSELVATSEKVAATSRRTEKVALLADLLRRAPREELEIAASFLAGAMPRGRIGLGYASLRDLPSPSAVASLQIGEVDRAFAEIAAATGAGSTRRRSEILSQMMARATEPEQSFLARLIIGELRQGALESVLLDAIAKAAGVSSTSVRRAQMVKADLGAIASAAMSGGEALLSGFELTLFAPIMPMLAQTAETVTEALERFSPAAFEVKLDGARVQVHKSGGEVRAYSRRLNEVTARVPELVEQVAALPAKELILDGETIALSKEGSPLPFQVTMKRFGRRLDVEAMRKELPLSTFFFDCLRLEGETLLSVPAKDRFEALARCVPDQMRVERIVTSDREEADAFLGRALDRGHEGVMAKSLDAPYEAGNRGASWLKLKAVHTFDLVVIAVEWGSGRREGWLSNLHLAARDEATGQLVMLGKTFKGMTDEMLAWQTKRFLELETRREAHVVYLRPEVVVEVAIGDVQVSPHYPGGIALRFARVKRYRPDKRPEEADTLEAVRKLLPH